jgi:hypothetical protein
MTCREYQFQIGTGRAYELAEDRALQAHVSHCEGCSQAYLEMRQLSAATSLLQPLTPSADFAQRVHQQVRETTQVKPLGLFNKLLGPLRAPVPNLQSQHLIAGLAVILIALVLLVVLIHPVGLPNTAPTLNVPSIAQPGGGQPVDFPAGRSGRVGQPGAPAHAP